MRPPSTASALPAAIGFAPEASFSTKSLCSIRDAEQGVYEYLAEKHEPAPSLARRAFAVPVRLSGWLWRREGFFRRQRRRFCVFDAAHATLSIFANDDSPAQRRLLARFVVTHVTLQPACEFVVQGYVHEREIHRGHAAARTRPRSSLSALPGDHQRFFLPETETLRAVSDKSLRIWSHCFRSHMKSPARLWRLQRWRRRLERLNYASTGVMSQGDIRSEGSDGTDDNEDDDDTDEDVNPDFQFEEPECKYQHQRRQHRIGPAAASSRRRYFSVGGDSRAAIYSGRCYGEDSDEVSGDMEVDNRLLDAGDPRDHLIFDQERDLRITTTYQALPSTTFFESGRMEVFDLSAEEQTVADTSKKLSSSSSRVLHSGELRHVELTSSLENLNSFGDVVLSQEQQLFLLSSARSIWADEELLSYRVDIDAIEKKRQLSVGAFGEVWLAEYRGKTRVAVKHLRSHWSAASSSNSSSSATRQDIQCFLREIRILCRLKHERIVTFLGVAWTMERDVQLVMEFAPGGDLRTFLDHVARSSVDGISTSTSTVADSFRNPWTWSQHQWRIAIDVVEALVYLHSLSPALVHCDVKSPNVLLGNDLRAKLSDFGIARYLSEDEAVDASKVDAAFESGRRSGWDGGHGTGRWMAPEVLTGASSYSIASDVYAFGVLLSEIDTCAMPFSERIVANASGDGAGVVSEDVLVHRIVSQEWTPAFSAQCPDAVRALAQQCLVSEPQRRPTSLEAAYRLRKAASQRENAEGMLFSLTRSTGAAAY